LVQFGTLNCENKALETCPFCRVVNDSAMQRLILLNIQLYNHTFMRYFKFNRLPFLLGSPAAWRHVRFTLYNALLDP